MVDVDFSLSQLGFDSMADSAAGCMSGFLEILDLPDECTIDDGGAALGNLEPEPLPELPGLAWSVNNDKTEPSAGITTVPSAGTATMPSVTIATVSPTPSAMVISSIDWSREAGSSLASLESVQQGTPNLGATLSEHTIPDPSTGQNKRRVQESIAPEQHNKIADRPVFLRARLGNESVSSCGSSCASSDPGSTSEEEIRVGSSGGVGLEQKSPTSAASSCHQCSPDVGCQGCHPVRPVVPTPRILRRRSHSGRRSRKKRRTATGSTPGVSGAGAGASDAWKVGSKEVSCSSSWEGLKKLLKRQMAKSSHPVSGACAIRAMGRGIVSGICIGGDSSDMKGPYHATGNSSVDKSIARTGLSQQVTVPVPAVSTLCSVFSSEPRPDHEAFFSVEQCVASVHPTAVVVYVIRVRRGRECHVVRRTWDDFATLCIMLRSGCGSGGGVSTIDGSSYRSRGVEGGVGGRVKVEFAPNNLLGSDASTGFLHELLCRPGLAQHLSVRRFLELEFLDGTFCGKSLASPGAGVVGGLPECLSQVMKRVKNGQIEKAGGGGGSSSSITFTSGGGSTNGAISPTEGGQFRPISMTELTEMWGRMGDILAGGGGGGGG